MSRFRGPSEQQHGKRVEALLKCAWMHLYPIHWSLRSQLSWKKSLLVTCQILGLLVNTFPTNENYPLLKRHNLTILIKVQLSQKPKTLMPISTVVRHVYMLLVDGSSETGLFRHFSDHAFGGRNFGRTKSMRVIIFFKLLKNYSTFQKYSKKLCKSFLFLR